jgi:hypothetical protein
VEALKDRGVFTDHGAADDRLIGCQAGTVLCIWRQVMAQLRIIILTDLHGQPLGAQLQAILQRENAYQVDVLARTLLDGTAGLGPRPDLIILLLPASKERAEHLLITLQVQATGTPLLLISQAIDLPERLDERFPWAMDFLLTPLREPEVRARVRRLLAGSRAPERHRVHKRTPETVGLAQLVGEDPAFVTLKRKLPLLAQCEAPVLLTGETGTGKGLCARALHYLSRRAGQPFLPVNCGAIPVELFERELFGHQKGAFTGAGTSNALWSCCAPTTSSSKRVGRGCRRITSATRSNARRLPGSSQARKVCEVCTAVCAVLCRAGSIASVAVVLAQPTLPCTAAAWLGAIEYREGDAISHD